MNLTVTDAPDKHRFEAWTDGKLAGFAAYSVRNGVIEFLHTEVDPAYEGKGVGAALARAALDDAAARGARVQAFCPFIADWIDRHPEYQPLTGTADGTENPG